MVTHYPGADAQLAGRGAVGGSGRSGGGGGQLPGLPGRREHPSAPASRTRCLAGRTVVERFAMGATPEGAVQGGKVRKSSSGRTMSGHWGGWIFAYKRREERHPGSKK